MTTKKDDPGSEIAPHISTREIAEAVGCSHSSVARALRGEKKVGPELRARILAKAEEMGYRPNPMVASLMAIHNRKQDRKHLSAKIGWINSHTSKDFWHIHAYNRTYIKAAEKRAREHGFGFEEIWSGEPGITGQRLQDILINRGIHGVVFSASTKDIVASGFDPSQFSAVNMRDNIEDNIRWHHAGTSGRRNAELAFNQLRAYGHKRIGLLIGLSVTSGPRFAKFHERIEQFNTQEFCDHSLLPLGFHPPILSGFYYAQQSIEPSERVRPFAFDHEHPQFMETIGDYLKSQQLDAILCNNNTIVDAVQSAGIRVPEELSIAHLSLGDDVPDWAGIEPNPEKQAAAAIDLLAGQILRNERGAPQYPQFIQVEGEWHDGWTVRIPEA